MRSIVDFFQNLCLMVISSIKIVIKSKFIGIRLPKASENDELIILGNGPSLKTNIQRDLKFLKSKKKICVNGFSLSEDYENVKPEFYLIADFAFWMENPNERIFKFRNDVLSSILNKTNWPITLFVPFDVKRSHYFKSALMGNSLITICYFNKTSIKGFQNFCNCCYKMNLGIPRPQNVLVPSIIIGINMGFKKIYLLGTDHSWHEQYMIAEDNLLCMNDFHFYQNKPVQIPIVDHKGHNQHIHQQFEILAITFKNYHFIEKYAKYRKAKILNASEKSYIDAFERIKLN
jgi:hypothetical protein